MYCVIFTPRVVTIPVQMTLMTCLAALLLLMVKLLFLSLLLIHTTLMVERDRTLEIVDRYCVCSVWLYFIKIWKLFFKNHITDIVAPCS